MTAIDPAPPDAPLSERLQRSLLGGGVLYIVLYVGTHLFLAATAGTVEPVTVAMLAMLAVAQVVLMLRRDRFVEPRTVAVVCVALVAVAVAGAAMLPLSGEVTGYAAWSFGGVTFVLLALTVAGRYAAAWVTMAAIVGVAVGWSLANGFGWGLGAAIVVRHAGTLLVGTALAIVLRRSNAASEAFRAVERRRRADERAAQARGVARRAAAESVLAQAGPMLRLIAEGRGLTSDDRAELLALEGSLRDQIRAPRLARGALADAVASARRRGVGVLLLDEAGDADERSRDAAVAWLADAVAGAEGSRFIGRLRGLERGVAVSAVTDEGSRTASFPAGVAADA